ncbi:MAG: 3-phosphoshikimate 1-carboxyvinyltransferase [Candidatus Omnitrophica bacterium]|nr:3-phosphoshikimate 1-carboxyvinyltransferase [Candidatus Omnitrophota bacterium]
MSTVTIEPKRIHGELTLPPDKSISHRAVIIGSLAQGRTRVKNLSFCDDCTRTLSAFKEMGVSIAQEDGGLSIEGKGLLGLQKPKKELYLGNSGTSMRLILGVLAGQKFSCMLTGDDSLSHRPMKRVTEPLSLMGAKIEGREGGNFAPLSIQGGNLRAISYRTPMASAQVKSAILLAGLYATGNTVVSFSAQSRDHTERMLKKFGADVLMQGLSVSIFGKRGLIARDLEVPGDISSASFFLAAACINRDSQIATKSIGLNPTRTAFLDVLKEMGASLSIKYDDPQMAKEEYQDEATGEVVASYSQLRGITIYPERIPLVIDELPVLMVVATQAKGETKICGAGELRVKETDRINAMVINLSKMGADIENCGDDIVVHGPTRLKGVLVDSFHDHRTAMSMAVAGLIAEGRTTIESADCVDISFPGFFDKLSGLVC